MAPDIEAVTEGRIKNRIQTILKFCSRETLSDSLLFLDESFDFFTLAEPLALLGLTRRHLIGLDKFDNSPRPFISNDVVYALEKFRSQVRETSTFVTRWLTNLCEPYTNLTPKQLKVEKVVKTEKT